jgi:peptidyl-prolyl cis-trans isomerase A (cyclophilin A)
MAFFQGFLRFGTVWRPSNGLLALIAACGTLFSASQRPQVLFETEAGEIVIEVETERAPVTAANFLRYVDAGHYADGVFHRTVTPRNQPSSPVKIEVVQAGINPALGRGLYPAIMLERTSQTGLRHLDGVLSMAREKPDTATSDFFICIGDQPALDFGGGRNPDGQGFAAFGRVVRGMDVVRRIQESKAEGQKLVPPIRIRTAKRLSAAPGPQ